MEREEHLGSLTNDGNFSSLATEQEYARYFGQLHRVFRHVVDCYPNVEGKEGFEGPIIRDFIQTLLTSVELLQLKYAFPQPGERPFWIDITESGFPNQLEIAGLASDMESKAQLLRDLPASSILRRTLVDELFRLQESPLEILRDLSRRTYLEKLEPGRVFLPFNATGLPVCVGSDERTRKYFYAFACYDFATNRPYIHFLHFEQDLKERPLEDGADSWKEFLSVIRAEGSRAPSPAVLATSIDEGLESIHPKALKRLCIGPLYSRVLLQDRVSNESSTRERYFKSLLEQYSRADYDFVLLLTEETVFSKRQEISRGVFSAGKIREIFSISESDPECVARGASAVNHYFLMPHELLQHVEPAHAPLLSDFSSAKKLTIDDLGEVHGL